MLRQTVFGFKLESSDEALTAHGGLALMAECNHGLGLKDWRISIRLLLGVLGAMLPRCLYKGSKSVPRGALLVERNRFGS